MPFSLFRKRLFSTVRLAPSARMPAPLCQTTLASAKVIPRMVMSAPAVMKIPLPWQGLPRRMTSGATASIVTRDARHTAQSAYVPGSIRTTSPSAAMVAAWLGTFSTRVEPTGNTRASAGTAIPNACRSNTSVAATKRFALCLDASGRVSVMLNHSPFGTMGVKPEL
jgi:hypothetical protein